jgi:hypothetical protein
MWVPVLAAACSLLVWVDLGRVSRVEYVSGLMGRARTPDLLEARSPTGYADGQRDLIVPEASESAFDWIAQTQQMFSRGELRVRQVDYENAPNGRPTSFTSPYRWWLGVVAWVGHEITGRPIGYSVERAALYSDALLHVVLLVGIALFAAWRLGGFAAALLSVGIVGFFPFASAFLPGAPDQLGLEAACALGSIILLVAGLRDVERAGPWFAAAGFMGGLGMWVSVAFQFPIMVGIFAGALFSSWVARGAAPTPPWRTWGLSSGIAVMLGYLAEYFPSDMGSWTMETLHPAYGVALIGMGFLLSAAAARLTGKGSPSRTGGPTGLVLSLLAVAAVPLLMLKTGGRGFLAQDLLWPRLTRLPGGAVAPGTLAWLLHDGMTAAVGATLLPLALLIPALVLMLRSATAGATRASIALAAGPVLVAASFASERLGWWVAFDATVLGLVAAMAADGWPSKGAHGRWILAAVVLAAAGMGFFRLLPLATTAALTPKESEELVDRHLAHWLSRRSGGGPVVVFAPPNESVGLWFYGGLRGIGSFSPDNRTGFGTTLNIAASTSIDDVQNNLRALGARYVVVPSWDPFFDNFAELYLDRRFAGRPSLFVGQLRQMNLPAWLRPVPYQMPVGGGPTGQRVLVFEVVDDQPPAAAAGRLAEYLVETGDLERAAAAGESLRRFPGDVGALAARAQVQGATGDTAGAAATLQSLLARLGSGGDRYLPWDRRVSLSIVLVQAGRVDLAREQVRRCIAEVNEERLRSLSTGSLYALLVLGHSLGLDIADPRLRDLAPDLLPADLRSRI